jgi:phosphoribosyl 1,2-cyclic phosphate phosphodiesterase
MSLKFTILGCGSSMGVPRPDGYFGKCNPNNLKNYRTRCSAILQTKTDSILIDTSPDLRTQLIKNKINNIDKVLYSHMHADQTHGINDLRVFYIKKRKPIKIYADKITKKHLNNTFSYCFKNSNKEYPAILKMNLIKDKFLINNGPKQITIRSIKVEHGKVNSLCYIFDKKLAYISDVSKIYKKDYRFFKNLKYLVIDCLWYKYHPSHLNLEQSLELIKIFSPKKAVLTNLHSELDYEILKKKLPKNVVPAYDGLNLYF